MVTHPIIHLVQQGLTLLNGRRKLFLTAKELKVRLRKYATRPLRDVETSSQTYQSRLILILPCHLLTDFEASNLWGKKLTKAIQYSN